MVLNFTLIGVGVLALAIISIVVVRGLRQSLNALSKASEAIANGQFAVTLDTKRNDEIGPINQAITAMAQRLQQARDESEAHQAEMQERLIESTRILEALNATSTNVMIADADRNIIYMNRAVTAMLRGVEKDLQKALPHFKVDTVIGSNMDIFHKNPAHQADLLATLEKRHQTQIQVANLHFRLTANPIFDKEGKRLGSIVEWLDRTAEVEAEKEIGHLVNEAAAGNFTIRAKEQGKADFMLFMAQSLNKLMSTADHGLADVARVLMALSNGDLTQRITQEYSGQFDDLKRYCNETCENLSEMIGEIRTAAETISHAASEIAQGNADLSSRTENQASNLQETASSMEEMTSTVRQNSENVSQASSLSSEASEIAQAGGQQIREVVNTMAAINESAQKISDIIGVIDSIAFQTNILALNAAVEAARAGEQGRGFAVVASEVRTLAQRSADAAKDIKELISDSVAQVADGNKRVNASGETMARIVSAIERVSNLMEEVSAASKEQASGIDEINQAVLQMDEMTQQNAALVEEAAASADSMRGQAATLRESMSRFKLDQNNGGSHFSLPAPKVALSKPKAASKPAQDEWEEL
ncbi:HAMP domain-containing protein [Maribrevibacterium harenarium]|uniref:HAMP domain-containing protein n=1 Tax=Maribrevibacterium harenarium TaxID=2589817 RepID=A0A501WT47_9GAMM|nr:methyl-accepting chemotaxis protein [Maribrevibacterium harenarium]TPE51545.1 HAMP domain-containing protein [Maribrevibacterium harenarium]